MLRIARVMRESTNPSPLQSIVALGLAREFQPPWRLPLPMPLPQNQNKHTLVLDIDETLIHTYGMERHQATSGEPAVLKDVPLVDFHVLLRPHLKEFLSEVNDLFELVFWTAGTASYCSAILSALESQVLQLPPSIYSAVEMAKNIASGPNKSDGTNHVNFFALSRTQTLERQRFMKYLPMLGRPMKNVIMLDDNVRSFPLNPRHGIKISEFYPDDQVLQKYVVALNQTQGKHVQDIKDTSVLLNLENGVNEMNRLMSDRALLDILPVLRAVAKVPPGSDVSKELDHWRDPDYVKCDNFMETMNVRSVVYRSILGNTLPSRSEKPIPPLKLHPMNTGFVDSANAEMQYHHLKHPRSKM